MCAVDDAEQWKVYRSQVRHARKPYRCDECGREIAKGESYRYITAFLENWWTLRSCAHCWEAAKWMSVVCGGHLSYNLAEELADHWNEEFYLRSWGLARIVVGISSRWRDGRAPIPTWAEDCAKRSLAREAA